MPQTFSTGHCARKRWSSRPGMAVRPEGFSHVEAIFATTLLGARPTEKVRTIRSKAKLLLHGMKSLCYGDPAAFNREALGNQEDHHGLSLACGDNIQTDCVGS